MCEMRLYIPENEFGIPEGYYTLGELSSCISKYKNDPDAIQFIAEMMEE